MKILLVEDDPAAMNLLKGIIVEAGFDTVHANSVEKAVSQLQQNPDCGLAISNLKLPDKDGFAFLKILKSSSRFRNLPVMICTRHGDPESVARAVKAGAKGFVVKPLTAETLVPKVMDLLHTFARTALIADVEKTTRDLLGGLLEREGYFCMKAESAEQALEILRKSKVNIVIAHADIPSMSGLELLGKVKRDSNDTPVVLITESVSGSRSFDDQPFPPDGIICKPFKNTEIIRYLRHLTQKQSVPVA